MIWTKYKAIYRYKGFITEYEDIFSTSFSDYSYEYAMQKSGEFLERIEILRYEKLYDFTVYYEDGRIKENRC